MELVPLFTSKIWLVIGRVYLKFSRYSTMAEEMTQSIKKLTIKRGHIKAQLTKFHTFLANIVLPERVHKLRVRKRSIEKLLQ